MLVIITSGVLSDVTCDRAGQLTAMYAVFEEETK